jgi:hypothetical protein
MAVTGNVSLSISGAQSVSRDLGSGATNSESLTLSLTLLAGASGASAVDRMFFDQRALAASATEDLDLVGTTLLDFVGTAVSFAKIKAIGFKALATNTNNVIIGAGTNPWVGLLNSTGTITLRPGTGFVCAVGSADATGYATTATTGDILKVANSGGTTGVDYQVAILGTVA